MNKYEYTRYTDYSESDVFIEDNTNVPQPI